MPSKQERDWQAEYDANTLANAEVIKQDPKRMKSAQTAAKKKVEAEKTQAAAFDKIAKGKLPGTKRAAAKPGKKANRRSKKR